MKRIISLLLLSVMILDCLVACTGENKPDGPSNDTTAAVTTAADTTADPNAITTYLEPMDQDLIDLDYGGEVINIISRKEKGHTGENEMWVEEFTNDPVNDAIYNRNLVVQELLGVEIREERAGEFTELQEKVELMVHSDDQTYDIVAASVAYGSPMINEGLMYNLYDNGIENYLDPTKPWWAQYWIDEAETGDRLYCITGAPALSLTRLMFVTYYNKQLAETYKLEDLYTVVTEGRWTMDYLAEAVSGIYTDNNGNTIRDEEDTYGIFIDNYVNVDIFWSSFDMHMMVKDEDGWFEMATGEKEKISTAFDKIYNLIYENTGSYNMGPLKEDSAGSHFDDRFSDGNALFAPLELIYAESKDFRNMQDEYGILPTPKFDEKQEQYFTYAHDQYTIFMIPITVKDQEMSGAVLEAMAYESYKNLHPVYYDVVLKGRYANDPQSRQMLDMITSNITVDPAWIYGRQLGIPAAKVMRDLIGEQSRSFATAYAQLERMLPFMLKQMRSDIEKLDY